MAACAVVLFHLSPFLDPHTLPMRGGPALPFQGSDLSPQFAVWQRVASEAMWDRGELALWSPYTLAGQPLLAAPQTGVFSLGTWLGAIAEPAAAIKWSMVLHVLIGMFGAFALARTFGAATPAAGVGALAFGLGWFLLDRFRVGHLNQLYPMALMPWVLQSFWLALARDEGWPRHAIVAGALVAAQIVEGSDSALLYQALALAIAPLAAPLAPWPRAFFLRSLAAGCIVAAAAFALSAFQLLPVASYMALTDRADGLPLGIAQNAFGEQTRVPGLPTWIAAVAGLAWMLTARERRAAGAWLVGMLCLSLGAAHSGTLYAMLWRWVPGFDLQRIPARAMVLAGVVMPVLAALGVHAIWTSLSGGRKSRPRNAARSARVKRDPRGVRLHRPPAGWIAAALGALVAIGAWRERPPTPPMTSPEAEIAANHAMQWLRARDGEHRIHVWETRDRHWGTEHVTVPLGLEVIAGYLPTDHPDYLPPDFASRSHRSYLRDSYIDPAKLWGMLSVKYVLSQSELDVPGLRLAERVPPCSPLICQPPKSAGPFIYQNESWLPRGYVVQCAIAIVGPPRAAFETAMDVMLLDAFDPTKMAVLQVENREHAAGADVVISARGTSGTLAWGTPDAKAAVTTFLTAGAARAPAVAAPVRERGFTGFVVDVPSAGWLVVSERLALWGGWSSSMGPIRRANGVVGAVRASPGKTSFSYSPPGFKVGATISFVATAGWAATEAVLWSRRRRKRRLP